MKSMSPSPDASADPGSTKTTAALARELGWRQDMAGVWSCYDFCAVKCDDGWRLSDTDEGTLYPTLRAAMLAAEEAKQ